MSIAEKREIELLDRIAFLEDALMYHVGFVPEYTQGWIKLNPHAD